MAVIKYRQPIIYDDDSRRYNILSPTSTDDTRTVSEVIRIDSSAIHVPGLLSTAEDNQLTTDSESKLYLAEGLLHVKEQKAAAESGGSFVANAWRVRPINTVAYNTISGASLDPELYQITLPAGSYWVSGWAAGFNVGQHQTMLYNVTASEALLPGSNEFAADAMQTDSVVNGAIKLIDTTTIDFRHIVSLGGSLGMGFTPDNGLPSIFAELSIRRI